MDDLRLILPDATMAEEIRAYRREMLSADSSMDGCGPLRRMEDPAEWLAWNERCLHEETCPAVLVPATQYVCLRVTDNKLVGMIQLRHRFNNFLRDYGGHIGYSVRPSERRKGYAHWMLAQVLPEARKLGLQQVLVTCLKTNKASRQTILSCGGVWDADTFEPQEQVWLERYWITL